VADIAVYASLFLVSLGAATILPLRSEAVLTGLLLTRAYPDWLLLVVATTGNTLGSLVNWYLGGSLESFRHKRWFPVKPELLEGLKRCTFDGDSGRCY
jgi:membrane protein YqaA with SNARE-associated domain